jgi:FMN phosphatase YigB (HAD superfamily)
MHSGLGTRHRVCPGPGWSVLRSGIIGFRPGHWAELIEYARRLRPRYRTGIVSNSFVGAREREPAAYGFEDLVEEIVYSHEARFSKPDPRIYALICTRLDVPPGEMIFLDDVEACVAGARDAGIHAVRYRDNTQAIAEIEKLLASP